MNNWNGGILSGAIDEKAKARALYPSVEAAKGLVVLHRGSSFRGAVVRFEGDALVLRSSNSGQERLFRLNPGGFAVNGETVTLIKPKAQAVAPTATASGSIPIVGHKAQTAKASRLWVEGIHDAELVEKVWGEDLRYSGIVVERLDGIDDLASEVRTFAPSNQARLGVLVDHLVSGSKETRIVSKVQNPYVLVTGHPYVDVWQAIRPKTLGIEMWPLIPRGQDWKAGIAAAFGVPETGRLWKQLLGRVNSYADLEPDFVGAVEQLIDFVTEQSAADSGV